MNTDTFSNRALTLPQLSDGDTSSFSLVHSYSPDSSENNMSVPNDNGIKVNLDVRENLSPEQLYTLIDGLKKIEGFDFGIKTFIEFNTKH